jgi:hypothetical protein
MSGLVIDAAYPPGTVPAGVSGVMGYIGGPKALHTWTTAQWVPFAGLRQFPAYVPDLSLDPVAQADDAVRRALALGWAAHMPAAETRVIVFDTEADVSRVWWATMARVVLAAGFVPVDYGSLDVVLGNAAADVLAADWDGLEQLPAGQTIHGVQYAANVKLGGATVDYDLFDSWLMGRGGVGPRKGA